MTTLNVTHQQPTQATADAFNAALDGIARTATQLGVNVDVRRVELPLPSLSETVAVIADLSRLDRTDLAAVAAWTARKDELLAKIRDVTPDEPGMTALLADVLPDGAADAATANLDLRESAIMAPDHASGPTIG